MTDVLTFFKFLVAGLSADGRHAVDGLLKVGDILDFVMPYRANRRGLAIQSLEEYEVLVLRLCSGEGGMARLDPPELMEKCRQALASPEPGLELVPGLRGAVLSLKPSALHEALVEATFEEEIHTVAVPHPRSDEHGPAAGGGGPGSVGGGPCPSCGVSLPGFHGMAYCVHCGGRLSLTRCRACRSVVEPGWRHCGFCGQKIESGSGRT